MTQRKPVQLRDAKGRFNPGVSGNPGGRPQDPPLLPTLNVPTRERIMLAASRPVPALGEGPEGNTVTMFEACVEVMGFVRNGNPKSAADFVRTVHRAAASVPPADPLPQMPSPEATEAIITHGSDEDFQALLASQLAYFERLMAEMTDRNLATTVSRVTRARQRRSS